MDWWVSHERMGGSWRRARRTSCGVGGMKPSNARHKVKTRVRRTRGHPCMTHPFRTHRGHPAIRPGEGQWPVHLEGRAAAFKVLRAVEQDVVRDDLEEEGGMRDWPCTQHGAPFSRRRQPTDSCCKPQTDRQTDRWTDRVQRPVLVPGGELDPKKKTKKKQQNIGCKHQSASE